MLPLTIVGIDVKHLITHNVIVVDIGFQLAVRDFIKDFDDFF